MKKKKQIKYPLYVERSYRKCFSDGVNVLLANFSVFFRSMWLPCLLLGFVAAVVLLVPITASPIGFVVEVLVASLLVALLLSLFLRGQSVMLKNYTAALLNDEEAQIGLLSPKFFVAKPKSLNAFYLLVIQFFVIGLLAFGTSMLADSLKNPYAWIGFGLIMLLVPFNLQISRLLCCGKSLLDAIKWGFRNTPNRFGNVLILLVLSFIFIVLIAFVCYLPIFILSSAMGASGAAQMMGDPSDLPGYVPVMRFALGVVLFAFVAFSFLLWSLPQSYFMGSIKYMEEKKDRK